MTEETLPEQLTALGRLLTEVDRRLAQAPAAPAGLEDLKQSVDQLRTSMWAILAAGHGITAPARVERIKLRRAIQGLRAIQSDLSRQPGTARHPEHKELAQVALEVAREIGPG